MARFGRPDIRIRSYGFDNEIQGSLVPSVVVAGTDELGLNDIWPYPERDVLTEPGYNPETPTFLGVRSKLRSLLVKLAG